MTVCFSRLGGLTAPGRFCRAWCLWVHGERALRSPGPSAGTGKHKVASDLQPFLHVSCHHYSSNPALCSSIAGFQERVLRGDCSSVQAAHSVISCGCNQVGPGAESGRGRSEALAAGGAAALQSDSGLTTPPETVLVTSRTCVFVHFHISPQVNLRS